MTTSSRSRLPRLRCTAVVAFAGAVLLAPLLVLATSSAAGAAGADGGYRADWDMDPNFPACLPNAAYPIDYVTCLPDNTEPNDNTSLVYGRLSWSNGQAVQDYQIEGPGGIAELGINGESPYAEGDDDTEQDPAWQGWFAYLTHTVPGDPDQQENTITPGGEDLPWIFLDSDDGLATPFGGDAYTHPSDQTQWRAIDDGD
jgi:hypothetical protein